MPVSKGSQSRTELWIKKGFPPMVWLIIAAVVIIVFVLMFGVWS